MKLKPLSLLVTSLLLLPGGVAAQEASLGPPREMNGLEISAVASPPMPMDDYWGGLEPGAADLHLEADIRALPGEPHGFPPGAWIPYLTVRFRLDRLGTPDQQEGLLWQMVATDGPHYGLNVKLAGPGTYRLTLLVEPPSLAGLARHLGEQTGVAGWWEPFEASWEFEWPSLLAVGDGWSGQLRRVEGLVGEAVAEARAGRYEVAYLKGVAAYQDYELLEPLVAGKNLGLNQRLEAILAEFRWALRGQASGGTIQDHAARLRGELAEVRALLGTPLSRWSVLANSLVIILREGLEALLILGALGAYFMKTGSPARFRLVLGGGGVGILASLVTAFLLQAAFARVRGRQDLLEGVVVLVAAGVLFYCSYWLIARAQVARWKAFVQEHVAQASRAGNLWALGVLGFVVVYREGFETVLFYQALLTTTASREAMVLAGFLVGGSALLVLYWLIIHYGVRLPLRPFFFVTSGMLYLLAIVFTGQGLSALQRAGLVPETPVGLPRLDLLGLYPTWETVGGQLLLVLAVGVGLFYLRLSRARETVPK